MKIILFSFFCFICAVAYANEGQQFEVTPMHEEQYADGHKFTMKIRGKRSHPSEQVGTVPKAQGWVPAAPAQSRHKRSPAQARSHARPAYVPSNLEAPARRKRGALRPEHRRSSE